MDEYISRKAVMDAYEEEQSRPGPWRFEKLINSVPAADVAPVVHGRWVRIYEDGEPAIGQHKIGVCCSKCMKMPKDKITESDYCPNCGAKMDGGKENV